MQHKQLLVFFSLLTYGFHLSFDTYIETYPAVVDI